MSTQVEDTISEVQSPPVDVLEEETKMPEEEEATYEDPTIAKNDFEDDIKENKFVVEEEDHDEDDEPHAECATNVVGKEEEEEEEEDDE
eukprot:c9743_g1_i1 orf=209-475(-)